MKKLDKTAQPNSFIILILFFAVLVIMSSLYVTIPLIPVLSQDFSVSEGETVWISSLFTLCFAVSLDQPSYAYIASFDDGATYKGAVRLDSIEKKLPIRTKSCFSL